MAFPKFSLKRLLGSLTLICIGLGGIAFNGRSWHLSPRYDALADFEQLVRTIALVVGWVFVSVGIIPLVTTRRPAFVLILSLCGVIPGGIAGVAVRNDVFPINSSRSGYEQKREGTAIICLGMALGAVALPLLVGAFVRPTTPVEYKKPPRLE